MIILEKSLSVSLVLVIRILSAFFFLKVFLLHYIRCHRHSLREFRTGATDIIAVCRVTLIELHECWTRTEAVPRFLHHLPWSLVGIVHGQCNDTEFVGHLAVRSFIFTLKTVLHNHKDVLLAVFVVDLEVVEEVGLDAISLAVDDSITATYCICIEIIDTCYSCYRRIICIEVIIDLDILRSTSE